MVGAVSSLMRPVTVLPRRISVGVSLSCTRTAKVPVTGSARGETSRTVPVAVILGSSTSATVMPSARRAVLDLRRHVEHGVARAFACHLHDHAPGPHHCAGLGAARGDDACGGGVQLRVAQAVLGQVDVGARRVHLRLGRL